MTVKVQDLVGALALEPEGPDRYRASNVDAGHGVVFGGQLLAQSLIAALAGHEGMRVKTLHAVFARGASHDRPLEIVVDPMHAGRTFASSSVTISQGDRRCTRSIVLLSADEPDFISHADPAPSGSEPPTAGITGADDEWQFQIAGEVDIVSPEAVGPPDLEVWTRFPGAPDDAATAQALLAFATDGFLIATAMRPHDGVGQAQAHRTITTGVVSHTLTFHEPFSAAGWLLMANHSPYAGRGRSYGRADVFTEDGSLVASFVQDAMVRPMEERQPDV